MYYYLFRLIHLNCFGIFVLLECCLVDPHVGLRLVNIAITTRNNPRFLRFRRYQAESVLMRVKNGIKNATTSYQHITDNTSTPTPENERFAVQVAPAKSR